MPFDKLCCKLISFVVGELLLFVNETDATLFGTLSSYLIDVLDDEEGDVVITSFWHTVAFTVWWFCGTVGNDEGTASPRDWPSDSNNGFTEKTLPDLEGVMLVIVDGIVDVVEDVDIDITFVELGFDLVLERYLRID